MNLCLSFLPSVDWVIVRSVCFHRMIISVLFAVVVC